MSRAAATGTHPAPIPGPDGRPGPVRERSIGIDALRGAAVGLVLLYHAHEILHTPLCSTFAFGWVGVDLFFVISGFFMAKSVLKTAEWSLGKFMAARARRIVPAYYFCILVLTALTTEPFQIMVAPTGWWHFLSHLLFLHTFDAATRGTINGVFWTLGVEWPFYVLIALLAPLLRHGSRWFLGTMAAWCAIALAWRMLVVATSPAEGTARWMNSTQLPGTLDAFACGALVAFMEAKGIIAWLHARSYAMAAIALAAIALFGCCVATLNAHAGNYWALPSMVLGWRSLLAVTFALLLTACTWSDSRPAIAAALRCTGLPALGAISYSVYLYHLPVMLAVRHVNVESGPNALFASALVVILALSWASYRLIECRWHTPLGGKTGAGAQNAGAAA